jgi:3-methylcrotonyl-CoA carboxylase beta subunit
MSAPVLTTTLNPDSPEAQARAAHNRALADELMAKLAEAALGGSAKSRERHSLRRMLIGRELIGAA